jgi:hypothetical protein
MVKIKKCKNGEIEKRLTELLENRLIECNNQNQNENSKNEIEIPKKRKFLKNENDNGFEIKKRKTKTKNIEDNTFFHSSDDIFFICSERFDDTYRYCVRYINKEYEKDTLRLNDITSNAYNLFNNFHIEELFYGKDINSIKRYVHGFDIIFNNNKEPLKIIENDKELTIYTQQMNCIVRFFIIGIDNLCNNKQTPNMEDIFPDKNNIALININPLYKVIMDQKIAINPGDKFNPYLVFIKWELDYEKLNKQTTYFFGWGTTYLDSLNNFALTKDKFKHIYLNNNYNNQIELMERLEALEKKNQIELIERLEALEKKKIPDQEK